MTQENMSPEIPGRFNPTFLSNDGENLRNRIVDIEPLNEDNREKQGADGEKSHIKANSVDAKSSATD